MSLDKFQTALFIQFNIYEEIFFFFFTFKLSICLRCVQMYHSDMSKENHYCIMILKKIYKKISIYYTILVNKNKIFLHRFSNPIALYIYIYSIIYRFNGTLYSVKIFSTDSYTISTDWNGNSN